MTLRRRTVLGGLISAGLGACTTPGPADSRFPLGVASGDATSEGSLLWTCFTGSGPLEVVLWAEEEGEARAQRFVATTVDSFVRVESPRLNSGTWYRFRFEPETGSASPEGRFRTALGPNDLESITIGATCCINAGFATDALARAAERTDLDAFVLLGDAVYADGARSLADFRRAWRRGLASPDYQALRGSTSLVTQWDDHELSNNWGADTVPADMLDAARRAFLEHQPLRTNSDAPHRFWRSLRWGRTAELFVIDGRSERNRAQGQYLSPEQEAFLVDGVRRSDAAFKLVLNTVPIGAFDSPFFAPFNDDNWQGFPEARRRFLEGLDGTGAIILSGDFHFACFGQVATSGPGATLFEALVGPGAQGPNPLPSYPSGPPWEFSSALNNYTSFELNPFTGEATVRYHAGDGSVFFERVIS